ncbi:MAG: flagellar basal body P-ring formation protein FlgA [Candidatus Kapabacteria bacterium]|nr:flagellar basal body P-ring formation protein FlgA [Ignavibacteriota bacterium]MCW5885777.1 flagellar basal body P-ring formation protein FlgA [Candidatus Kapabacteria bacterium]
MKIFKENTTSRNYNVVWHYIAICFMALISHGYIYAASTFSSDRIEKAIIALAEERINAEAEIEFLNRIKTIEFPEDNISAEIIFDEIINPGFNTVALKFSHNGRLLKYIEINIRVKFLSKVWVASRSIPSNTKLNEKDFILKLKNISSGPAPLDLNEFIGRELSRSVMQDDYITPEMLASEVLIKRGDKVTIIVQSGGVRIRCAGTAVQDGAPGQQVRVKRDNSPAVLTGKVTDDGMILVYSGNLSIK